MKVKKGDLVKVISGKDRGKTGKIVAVLKKEGRVVVEKVNMIKKHKKKTTNKKDPGGIIEVEAPIYASKVMAVNSKDGKASRIGYKFIGGKKVRISKKSNTVIS